MIENLKSFIQTQPKTFAVVTTLTIIGGILRIMYFDWGDGFLFHPDERNIGYAISNLNFPSGKFNPEFWAYGSFPIYLIYLIAYIVSSITTLELLNFDSYLLIGRLLSGIFSTALIPLVFVITRRLSLKKHSPTFVALLATFFITFIPGMIQFAHFTTFETFLTFQYMILLIISAKIAITGQSKHYWLFGIVMGISLSTKMTSVVLFPLLPLAHAIHQFNIDPPGFNVKKLLLQFRSFFSVVVAGIIAALTSPFFLLDLDGFLNSFSYESAVADGSLLVFYTQQFIDTTPVIYQLSRIFPYSLTIPLTVLSIVAISYFVVRILRFTFTRIKKKKQFSRISIWYILTLSTIALYLGFHFSIYVKWTRYMIPSIPFLVVIISAFLGRLTVRNNEISVHAKIAIFTVSIWVMMSGMSFWQIYIEKDPRVEAAQWANTNISRNSKIVSEEYDLGVLPFNSKFSRNIELLPLYDLEHNGKKSNVEKAMQTSDYYISLSQRIYGTRYRLPEMYPTSYAIYHELFETQEDWKPVAKFSRDYVDCSVWTLQCLFGSLPPDETYTVFDHPTVIIFEKRN